MDTQSSITRTITQAGGRYAPGHPGGLTQHQPFDMIDAALTGLPLPTPPPMGWPPPAAVSGSHPCGGCWRGPLVCAIDGATLTVPDNPRILPASATPG